jgi:hypothetical protein
MQNTGWRKAELHISYYSAAKKIVSPLCATLYIVGLLCVSNKNRNFFQPAAPPVSFLALFCLK